MEYELLKKKKLYININYYTQCLTFKNKYFISNLLRIW